MASTLETAVFSLCLKLWSHPSIWIRERSISVLEDFELLITTSSAYVHHQPHLKHRFSEFLSQVLITNFDIRDEVDIARPYSRVHVMLTARGKAFVSFLNDLVFYRGLVEDEALKARWMEARDRLTLIQESHVEGSG